MNVRIFAAVVFAVLLLSLIELACVSHDAPTVSNDYPSATILSVPELLMETAEPDLPDDTDSRSLPGPILTR